MSKKVRRIRKSSASSTAKNRRFVEPPKKQVQDFQVEYAYVLKDLRRVFILAGIMFALLIVINLILQ